MAMNNLAIARNFFLFMEVEQFQVVYGLSYIWHVIEHLEYS